MCQKGRREASLCRHLTSVRCDTNKEWERLVALTNSHIVAWVGLFVNSLYQLVLVIDYFILFPFRHRKSKLSLDLGHDIPLSWDRQVAGGWRASQQRGLCKKV
jgi:hypothetical protein